MTGVRPLPIFWGSGGQAAAAANQPMEEAMPMQTSRPVTAVIVAAGALLLAAFAVAPSAHAATLCA